MQLRKALTELKLLTINRQRAIRTLFALYRILRQTIRIDTQKITHTGLLQLQITCYTVKTHHMNNILLNRTKYPLKHIIEMHANIRRNSATLVHIAFPGRIIPLAARCNIRQIHIIHLIFRTILHFLTQRRYLLVKTQLQYRISLMTCLRL